MSVDFTPSRGNYTELKPFRYWCQKVLPLVYDDSLSYYELLSKVLDSLNKAMEDVETLNDDVTALYTAYTALQDWITDYVETFFEGEGVQNAVNAKIDAMVVSGVFGTIVNDKVAAQINAVVANQLGTVVQGQLPSVVQTQIPNVVSSQLPGVVNNQIGGVVDAWLAANITPDTTLLDRTINATNKAPSAYDMKNMIQAVENGYSFIDKYTMFDYPGDITTGRNDLAVMEYMTRTWQETVSNKTVFIQYVKKGNSLNLYNPSSNEVHCYPSLIPITRNLLPPLSADFAVVSQTMPTIPNVVTSYNKAALLNYFINLKSYDTVKIVVDIPVTVTGSETPVVCLTGWKLVKIYVDNNTITSQNLADFTVTGSVASGNIHAECEYTFGDINKEAYDDPATVGFGLAILTGDTSVELTTHQESGFEEGVTYSDNTNFFPKDSGFNMTITGEVVDTELATEKHSNLLFKKPSISRWFIDPSTGVGRVLATFYSYENIDIPDGTKVLFPYNNFKENDSTIRSVCFYQADGTFISGVSGSPTQVTDGILIPDNAKKVSCTLTIPNTGYDGKHYLSTTIGGDQVSYALKDDVIVNSENIVLNSQLSDNIRYPVINFQFDDGNANDEYIVQIFDTFNLKCGFAFISPGTMSSRARYLGYQNKGYEIMSHSSDTAGMNDPTVDPAVIEQKLKNSKETLESFKFKIKGFVTPNSTMANVFKPILRKYYQWACTKYFGNYTGTGVPYQKPVNGVYNIQRVSLEGTTIANQKAAVDACIANFGCLTFYGHSATLDTTTQLTTANLTELLTYIVSKVQANKCVIDTPTNAICNYFATRNDDVSDNWIPVTASEVELDSRLSAVGWDMNYNDNLKLLQFTVRLNASENISGPFQMFKLPRGITEGTFVQNNANRECITYSGGVNIFGSNSDVWTQGTRYRFSGLFKIV